MSHRCLAISIAALGSTFLTSLPAFAAPSKESDKQRIERLESTVADLTRRLEASESREAARSQQVQQLQQTQQTQQAQQVEQAQQVQQLQQAQQTEETRVASAEKKTPDHNLELYGFTQLDAIQDFKRVNPDWDATLRPSRIPTTKGEFGSDGQTVFSVRQTRLGAKANGTLAGKPYEAKFEFDLYGTGVDAGQTTFRVRHMYGKWGPFLAGQTNTLFMDGDEFPNVIDYWGPTGMVFVRNPQIRFSFVDNEEWFAAVALEHPSDDIDPGAIRLIDPELATNLKPNEELPDLTAQVQYRGSWGHVTLAGLARKIGFDTAGVPDNEPSGSEFGWGIHGGAVVTFKPATLRLGVVYGKGIASYMNDGGMDLAPSAQLIPFPPIFPPPPQPPLNELLSAEAVPLLGVTAYVDLQWTGELSSSIGYSFTKVNNTNFQDATAFHRGDYASGNLLWTPADRILTGLELLWGKRTDNDGNSGTDFRAQYSFKVSFSSKDIWGD